MSVLAWLRERCPPWLVVPWVAFLATPALTRGADPIAALGLVVLLVVGARLLDDLADRDHDRAEADEGEPLRVLAQADDVRPFLIAWVGLALGSLALAGTLGRGAAQGVLVLWLGLSAWYAIRPAAWRRLSVAVVLLKYPAIVALSLPTVHEVDLLALAGVTLGFFAYELLHDERHQAAPLGWALTGALVVGAVLNRADLPDPALAAVLLAGVATLPFARARVFAPFPFALPWLIP